MHADRSFSATRFAIDSTVKIALKVRITFLHARGYFMELSMKRAFVRRGRFTELSMKRALVWRRYFTELSMEWMFVLIERFADQIIRVNVRTENLKESGLNRVFFKNKISNFEFP